MSGGGHGGHFVRCRLEGKILPSGGEGVVKLAPVCTSRLRTAWRISAKPLFSLSVAAAGSTAAVSCRGNGAPVLPLSRAAGFRLAVVCRCVAKAA